MPPYGSGFDIRTCRGGPLQRSPSHTSAGTSRWFYQAGGGLLSASFRPVDSHSVWWRGTLRPKSAAATSERVYQELAASCHLADLVSSRFPLHALQPHWPLFCFSSSPFLQNQPPDPLTLLTCPLPPGACRHLVCSPVSRPSSPCPRPITRIESPRNQGFRHRDTALFSQAGLCWTPRCPFGRWGGLSYLQSSTG